MTPLTQAQATTILTSLGWRIHTTTDYRQAVQHFQAGWNLGTALEADGHTGPKTSAALRLSDARRQAGLGDASAHFSFAEVACRCGGRYASCPRVWQQRDAFVMMEDYRARSASPLSVVSGCRCPHHNTAVGGSPTSRHLTGLACDVAPRFTPATVKSWHVATHIGYGSVSGKVVHIDHGAGRTVLHPAVYVDGH